MKPSGKLIIGLVVLVAIAGGLVALKSNRRTVSVVQPTAGGPMGGPMGSPMGDPGQFAELQKSHQYAFQLMKLVGNIGRLESDGKSGLTPQQAKAVLAVLQPLRKRESLDETSAKEAMKALQAVLTDKQRSAISALPPEHKFHRGSTPPGPPPTGTPSGPPPAGGPKAMKGFNPLNPPAGGPMGQPAGKGVERLFENLEKKSKG
ncbi:MAG: hypothetical protein ABFD54_06720 [Armatimonadota bacterium]|nr:hypothetical protein [bacterium]